MVCSKQQLVPTHKYCSLTYKFTNYKGRFIHALQAIPGPYSRLEDTSLYLLPPRLESPDQDYPNNWKHTEAYVFKYVDDFFFQSC